MTHSDIDPEELDALVADLRREYGDDPNVQTVGWGLAERGGETQDAIAIVFYVDEKLPSDRAVEAAGSTPIPEEIDGYPTDVVEADLQPMDATGDRDSEAYDPLLGGPASSNSEEHIWIFNSYGTLGLLCRDTTDGAPMALSNWHVWADGGDRGDEIIQPGHPTAGHYVESAVKIAACGPTVTSLIEGEVPSPLAAGLYGGAAAAAAAAALSDYRDPIRRGQDATAVDTDETTEAEHVGVSVEYPEMPWPGTPFTTDVEWQYQRQTDQGTHTHDVSERRQNAQFLLGQYVTTDAANYDPGDRVEITAALWDYQDRPADAYHVVAHLVSTADPDTALRTVLHPAECPDSVPIAPPDDEDLTCIDFADYQPGATYPYKHRFDWLSALSADRSDLRVVDWSGEGDGELRIPERGLSLSHPPARRVRARVAQYASSPVTLTAKTYNGVEIDSVTAPNAQDEVHDLVIEGEGDAILAAELVGGDNEAVLLSYCIEPQVDEEIETTVTEERAEGLLAERAATHMLPGNRLRGHRRCFEGRARLPPTEDPGQWEVYLVAQNLNDAPFDAEPDEAATTIGGHVLTGQAEVAGCAAVMLADHVFDVI